MPYHDMGSDGRNGSFGEGGADDDVDSVTVGFSGVEDG